MLRALVIFSVVLLLSNMTLPQPFYIYFERSGGVTGITSKVEINSKTLPGEESQKLKELIESSGIFEFQKKDTLAKNIPDQFQYELTITYKGKRQSLILNESEVPDSLRPLINYLTRKARTQGKP